MFNKALIVSVLGTSHILHFSSYYVKPIPVVIIVTTIVTTALSVFINLVFL